MSEPATPTKRVLTEDVHAALHASRVPYGNFISDDLTARLQNLGSRVRKSVSEGYTTQRFGGVPSATPTPFSSPVKSASATVSPQATHIFRSANETLVDVFSSPMRSKDIASPSPSPRKRGYAEADLRDDPEVGSPVATINEQDEVSSRHGMEVASDDDDIAIITETNTDHGPSRPIRPLKKTASVYRPPDPSTTTTCATESCVFSSDSAASGGRPLAPSSRNIFNQDF